MTDEKPLSLKKSHRKASLRTLHCIIHYKSVLQSKKCLAFTDEKLLKVKDAAMLRSEYGSTVFERQDEISQRILMLEHLCKQEHRYHGKCLKMFTNTARIKQKKRKAETQEVDEPEDNDSIRSPRKKKHSCLLPSDQCIFCHKRVKKHGNKFQKLVQLTSKEKASEIKDRAESVSQEDSHPDINIVIKRH